MIIKSAFDKYYMHQIEGMEKVCSLCLARFALNIPAPGTML